MMPAKPVSSEALARFRLQERFDCFNRDELELMIEPYAQDAVFDLSEVFTDSAPVRGHEEILGAWRELRETWGGGVRLDPLELLEVGDRRFVLDLRLWGKGTRSGVEVDQRFAFLYVFAPEEDEILSARLLPDVATAIAEAESSASPTA